MAVLKQHLILVLAITRDSKVKCYYNKSNLFGFVAVNVLCIVSEYLRGHAANSRALSAFVVL